MFGMEFNYDVGRLSCSRAGGKRGGKMKEEKRAKKVGKISTFSALPVHKKVYGSRKRYMVHKFR